MSHSFRALRLVVFLAVTLPIGCGPSEQAAPDKPASQGFTIGVSQCNLGEPWRVQMNADLKAAAAKHPNLAMVFKDAENDTQKQQAQVEELVAAGVNLLIVSPKEAQPLTSPVAKAYEAGIPVIVLDRALVGDQYTCFIGADNKKIGRAAGKWLAKRLDGKGRLVELMGLATSTPSQDRHAGFEEVMVRHPDIRVLYEIDMKWLEPDARKAMEAALAKFEKIDAVFAHNDPGAHGAYLAAKAAGRERQMLFVGIDALPQEGQKYVSEGILNVTFQYPTGGAEAIDTALKILAGQQVPKKIVLGSRVFTPENIARGGDVLE
ncbi:MAG: substrate-binding domain-containing protein [Thermoguttaceae bacterium]